MKRIIISLALVFLVLGIASILVWNQSDSGSTITSAVTVADENEVDKLAGNVSVQVGSEEVENIEKELK